MVAERLNDIFVDLYFSLHSFSFGFKAPRGLTVKLRGSIRIGGKCENIALAKNV